MKKPSPLAAGLKAMAAGQVQKQPEPIQHVSPHQSEAKPVTPVANKKAADKTVMIGAHFSPQVRRALLLVQAHPNNEGKLTKELLGEAINDLCAKYGVPEPYRGE
ncbi:hypothetical protein SAMN05216403_1403 [Nitrosospira multiformis ATCC 25196]|uniref:Antitoxin-like ribbon-helix-helix domain-containing protein n=1 Tax=Nitrosospira multiformis (strain ATCC 25196 / NCIMB 11849 / C 71) TaxID=323848 RepID=Q2Y580_NITMU|nr:ribbon-helix-helix domain-containing protein [Nitrosospira multiformis]ABB76091.1 hypothetical protein NmulC_2787 [Nitrosospira multiformis ATCC 25196]SEG16554.1 hypothetical protein SAMN05216403_1403 [Nitrosospira multiformis ATCC 25196]